MAQAGFNGQLFIGTQGNGATANQEVLDARDVTVNLTGETFETSSRRTAPWKAFISGWKEWSADFTLVHENDETVIDTLETAFIAGTVISVRLIDDDGDGYYGDCIVTNFTREEPLADAMGRSVTLQGTGAATVINVAS
jgi:predicted secreted protein